jgi:crotonobetainyl-CoA:carnitine CoA-transferase CaiB-like acyl-CoA transferase
MLNGLRIVERGSFAAFAGRLLVASGASVGVDPSDADPPILRPWLHRGKTEFLEDPDLVIDGRIAHAPVGRTKVPTARITPFGEDGPWAGWQGNELVHQALSGWMALDGYDGPDEPPVMAAGGQAEIVGGLMGAIAGLLVLNGAGSYAATSWHEALAVGHETEFAAWVARGERYLRHTGQHASFDVDPRRWQWRCADGRYVNLILPLLTTQRWTSIVGWLSGVGMAADLTDERFLKGRVRLAEERHIYEVLGAFVGTMTADEAFEGGQARDLPWGVVRRPEENLTEPQFAGRPIFESGLPWRVTEGPPPPSSWTRRPGSVRELRVLDLTWQVAGPTMTRILAHAGADVVKVERPDKPELMRFMPVGSDQPYADPNASPFFANLNAGKRSAALDLGDRAGILRLVAAADVVVENFSSRVMDKLGLSFDDLCAANPSVVYLSLSGFGHEGPRRDYDTWGPTAQGISGCTWLSGHPGREPAGFGWSYLDYIGGYFATVGLLAAVWATRRDGRPRWVDVSQVECGLVCATDAWLAPGSVQPGNDGPVVRGADGRWVVGLDRVDGRDSYAAVRAAQAEGRAAGVVQDVADRLEYDEQLRHLGTYPVLDGVPYEATPIRVDGRVLPLRGRAPKLGEHSEEVLREWL